MTGGRRRLEAHEASVKAQREAEASQRLIDKQRSLLKQAVRDVLPARLKQAEPPKRPVGAPAKGGITKKQVMELRAKARRFLAGAQGLAALEAEVQHTALVILLIDGVLGTEPWRASGSHSGLMSANARFRYLENAARIIQDIRRAVGAQDEQAQLTAGVFDLGDDPVDAEVADAPGAAATEAEDAALDLLEGGDEDAPPTESGA